MIVICPYCKHEAQLVDGRHVYQNRSDLWSKKFWACDPCDAYVGTHVHSNAVPLGRLANAELRALKIQVHALFDPLWRGGVQTRSRAYRKLAAWMNIAPAECHIGMFDEERCRKALEVLSDKVPVRKEAVGAPSGKRRGSKGLFLVGPE